MNFRGLNKFINPVTIILYHVRGYFPGSTEVTGQYTSFCTFWNNGNCDPTTMTP